MALNTAADYSIKIGDLSCSNPQRLTGDTQISCGVSDPSLIDVPDFPNATLYKYLGNHGVTIKVFNGAQYTDDLLAFKQANDFENAETHLGLHFESPLRTPGANGPFVEYYQALLTPEGISDPDEASFVIYSKGRSTLWISNANSADPPCQAISITDGDSLPIFMSFF